MSGKADSVRTILYALGANFAIFIAKGSAAVVTGSGSMTAEAVHSLADCANQGLLLFGLKRAKLPASADYPLGHGKAIYFWSFLVALLLFSIGGMFSIYEGLHKLREPEALSWPWLAVGVLAFSIVAEAISMRAALREINKVREGRNLWRWFRESRASELIVIFGEDLAALLGLVLALIAVLLTMYTGNPMYDALGSMAIGLLLIVVAVFIAIEVQALLIGQSAEPRALAEMRAFLRARPEIKQIYSLISLQLGAEIMVAIKAEMIGNGTAAGLIEDINRVERDLRERFPDVRWCFFEPDSAN
ncbi:MAG: cation diffusion facilitator family transporter [Dokdonella sp.]